MVLQELYFGPDHGAGVIVGGEFSLRFAVCTGEDRLEFLIIIEGEGAVSAAAGRAEPVFAATAASETTPEGCRTKLCTPPAAPAGTFPPPHPPPLP